ncbi:hypothetical protein [Rhizobium leguminosarum]|uniref:hypothetical protein n=1 Tax=Rhizobium leguminosarum TaxID=384 RepID=UPI00140FCFA0|nr:hypothetical protein [Rhizobium leguminosarum]
MATLPPVAFGGQSGALATFIKEYQTLITGIVAVVAAYVTVRQMRATDVEAQRRHEETSQLMIRADKLRIERMLFPQFAELRVLYKQLRDMEFPSPLDDSPEALRQLEDLKEPAQQIALDIENIIDRESWTSATALYGGFLAEDIRKLRDAIIGLYQVAVKAELRVDDVEVFSTDTWEEFAHEFELDRRRTLHEIPVKWSTLHRRLVAVFQQLHDLAAQYKIEFGREY